MLRQGRRPHGPGFFWQLLLAFVFTLFVISVGMSIAGLIAFRAVGGDLEQYTAPQAKLWVERLEQYYVEQGNWDGVETFLGSYLTGAGEDDLGVQGQLLFTLADETGVILFGPEGTHVGNTLDPVGRALALPIQSGGNTIGYFAMPATTMTGITVAASLEDAMVSLIGRFVFLRQALGRLLLTEAIVVVTGLAIGVILSRRIAKPMATFTEATRTIASGNLAIRVDEAYPGEMGVLAASFNSMAEALQRSDELRRNLTADVAHELRTPLSVIRGKLEGILDGVYPATSEHLLPVLEETELLTRLVDDLRLLALTEAKQLSLDVRPMDVADFLRDQQVNFGPAIGDHDLTLVLVLPSDLPSVMADWQRVSQVVGNLIINAIHNTPRGGTVTLSASLVGQAVEVAVGDDGTGISPEDLPHVFERFWRGDRSRGSGGSGLGLAIARGLVALHGGTLVVESTPGKGSEFRFALPLA